MVDPEQCEICKKVMMLDQPTAWTSSEDARQVTTYNSRDLYALVVYQGKETAICEACYLNGAAASMGTGMAAELHYQFGLEYLEKRDEAQARRCFEAAIRLNRTATYVDGMAITASTPEEEIRYYEEALRIDPEDDFAKRNIVKARLRRDD